MANESVKAASEATNLVGKGSVRLPINGGMIVEGYHAPSFSSKILSVGLLKKTFHILFSKTRRPYPACFFVRQGSGDVVHEVRERDGLFPIPLGREHDTDDKLALIAEPGTSEQNDLAKEWHAKRL